MDGMNLGLFTGILHLNWLQGVYVLDEGLKAGLKFREHSHEHIGGQLKLNVVLTSSVHRTDEGWDKNNAAEVVFPTHHIQQRAKRTWTPNPEFTSVSEGHDDKSVRCNYRLFSRKSCLRRFIPGVIMAKLFGQREEQRLAEAPLRHPKDEFRHDYGLTIRAEKGTAPSGSFLTSVGG